MSSCSQKPVIDLTKEDEPIYLSSNEASDACPQRAAPSAPCSGTSTPTGKRRKRRKKATGLNGVPDHVKELLPGRSPMTAPQKSPSTQPIEIIDCAVDHSPPGLDMEEVENTTDLGPTSRRRKRQPAGSTSALFEIDTGGEAVSTSNAWHGIAPSVSDTRMAEDIPKAMELKQGLLLPSHATIVVGDSARIDKILAEAEASFAEIDPNEESFLDYQDEDKGFRRYWEADEFENESKRVIICARCGREGHRMKVCTEVVCEKCGIRNEHFTRSCPMSKKCFTCGRTGHINKDCPNRSGRGRELGCDRCGSRKHVSSDCPSLWRVYEYLSDDLRQKACQERTAASKLPILEGNAKYIGTEEWCYFCGFSGHLGDDCDDNKWSPYRPDEPSAFGTYNLQTGPFSDVRIESKRRGEQGKERDRRVVNGGLPEVAREPGRQAKGKRMESQREHARRAEAEAEEGDDWFGRRGRERRERRERREHDRDGSGTGKRSLLERIEGRRVHERESFVNGPRYRGGYER